MFDNIPVIAALILKYRHDSTGKRIAFRLYDAVGQSKTKFMMFRRCHIVISNLIP